jgi:hypothetical protein
MNADQEEVAVIESIMHNSIAREVYNVLNVFLQDNVPFTLE